MPASTPIQPLAPDLWLMAYPLTLLGADMKRNVTLIRLASGKLVVHSTAPFSPADEKAIRALGEPAWMADVLLRHDTFAADGRRAFPGAHYLAPEGFSEASGVATLPLLPPPPEWGGELAVAPVGGVPSFGEIAMFHRPSRTLIVGDLVFNFTKDEGLWTRCLLHLATVGGRHEPGVTRPFKASIKDMAAFTASVRRILEWDFDRIIVGHGTPIGSGGKEKLRAALKAAGIPGI
jgi:hypothetical protein